MIFSDALDLSSVDTDPARSAEHNQHNLNARFAALVRVPYEEGVRQGEEPRAKYGGGTKRLGVVAALVATTALVLIAPARAAEGPDTSPPTGAVGGVRSPASGTLELRLYASDQDSGLANAEAQLDGAAPAFVRLGSGSCPEHPSPGTEPPPGSCPGSVSGVGLVLDTHAVADGEHPLRVRVTDGAGNTATLVDRTIVVRNAPRTGGGTVATVTIGISSQGEGDHPGKGKGCEKGKACDRGKGGEKGKGLALRRRRCRKPRLRMHLARKPLWYTRPHYVPVLRYGRRYAYRGRLTCMHSGRRVSAPRGTKVGVYYRVWRLSFKRPWGPVQKLKRATLRVRKGGRLWLKLGFRSGRTLIFRYRDPGGKLAKAKLRLAVPPSTRRPPWGPR